MCLAPQRRALFRHRMAIESRERMFRVGRTLSRQQMLPVAIMEGGEVNTAYPPPSTAGLAGLCLPGVSCRGQSSSPPQGQDAVFAPPTATAGSTSHCAQEEAVLPGCASNETQASAAPPPILGIKSRQASHAKGSSESSVQTVGIPIPSRRDAEVNYVTDTVTTPSRQNSLKHEWSMRFPPLIVAVATKFAFALDCSDCVVLPWRLAHGGPIGRAASTAAVAPRCFPDHAHKNAQEGAYSGVGYAWFSGDQ
eukprot:s2219_g7.t1